MRFLALRCGAVSGKNEVLGIGADLEVIRKRSALCCWCFAVIAVLENRSLIISSLFVGHQLSGLGEHHVLRPRRTFLLGLDVLCRSNRGMQFPSC